MRNGASEIIPVGDVELAYQLKAGAIVSYIKKKAPERVSLVCMGTWAVTPADEDRLCAGYIADQLNSKKLSREDVYNKLKVAKTAKIFFDRNGAYDEMNM